MKQQFPMQQQMIPEAPVEVIQDKTVDDVVGFIKGKDEASKKRKKKAKEGGEASEELPEPDQGSDHEDDGELAGPKKKKKRRKNKKKKEVKKPEDNGDNKDNEEERLGSESHKYCIVSHPKFKRPVKVNLEVVSDSESGDEAQSSFRKQFCLKRMNDTDFEYCLKEFEQRLLNITAGQRKKKSYFYRDVSKWIQTFGSI